MYHVPKQRLGALCGFVGEFSVALGAFDRWRGLMLLWSAEFPLLRDEAGERREGDV